MITGHGGNIYQAAQQIGCRPEDIIDMSSNMNPLGPPSGLTDCLIAHLHHLVRLPEAAADSLVEAFARRCDLNPQMVLAGAGTTQFIHILPRALECRRVLIVGPTYADYADACRLLGVFHEMSLSHAAQQFEVDLERLESLLPQYDTVFVCNPNNPTGTLCNGSDLLQLCRRHPNTRFIVDESYLSFVSDADRHSLLPHAGDNILVLHSMSKIYRVPGLRVGFLAAAVDVAAKIKRYLWPWGVNSMAQTAAHHILNHPEAIASFIASSRALVADENERLSEKLRDCRQLECYPSRTVFKMIRLRSPLNAEILCEYLLQRRILVRNCANFDGLTSQFIRVSLKKPAENDLLIEQLRNLERVL